MGKKMIIGYFFIAMAMYATNTKASSEAVEPYEGFYGYEEYVAD